MSLPSNHYQQLITEELSGVITPEDKATLDLARATHPEVYRYSEEMRVVFSEPKVRQWLERESLPPALPPPAPRLHKRVWLALAVCLVGLIIGGFYLFDAPSLELKTPPAITNIQLKLGNGKVIDLSQEGKLKSGYMSINNEQQSLTYSISTPTQEWAMLSVPNGKRYKVTLSDGTDVFMNAATSIRFPVSFNNNSPREITITGEAYFNVARDANRPFVVNMPRGKVQVLGTSFNVNNYDKENPQVALVEGKVQFKAENDSAFLLPGIAAILSGQTIYTAPFDAEKLLAWREGLYLFNNKALEEILDVMPRLFGQAVILDNAQTGKMHFTGQLHMNKSIQKNLDLLNVNHSIDYYVDANRIIHIR